MTATLVNEYGHSPGISANFEGSTQALSGGDVFLGWGQQPYFSEDTASGQQDLDAWFTVPTTSYRAYRFPWSAQPPTRPAIAVSPSSDGGTEVYASWNGATDVTGWQVLAGSSPARLAAVGAVPSHGFETAIAVHSAARYFAVQAFGSSGRALSTSPAIDTGSRIALFGRSAFVPAAGLGAIPARCYASASCHVSTTITAGGTVIARTGGEHLPSNGGGLLYFSLSSTGRSMLWRARNHRLSVVVTARDASGPTATATLTLIPFSTSGAGPRRAVTESRTVQIMGVTDFVSSRGVGGILAGCSEKTPCHVRTTISIGRTVIATTGSEFLGANELGYLIFSLTGGGRSMLSHAAGNQLGAHVTVTDGRATAKGDIALVQYR
jgi:hypothetical protein